MTAALRMCLGLVFVTGATGLIYQVTWQQYLTQILGSHAFSTSLVLALFFLFMSVGYVTLGHFGPKIIPSQVRLYGVLELIIGLYALVSPWYFHALNSIWPASSPNMGLDVLQHVVLVALFLGVPTFCMGGTIPALVQGLSRSLAESSKTHSTIYGLNTLGAFVGTLLTGFYLVEMWGLPNTLYATGCLNILVAFGAFWVASQTEEFKSTPEPAVHFQSPAITPGSKWLLYSVACLSGFYFFCFESLIIRYQGIVLGSSSYNYAIVVAAFIFSIAMGSFLVSRWSHRITVGFFLLAQALSLAAWVILYFVLQDFPDVLYRTKMLVFPGLYNFSFLYGVIFLVFSTVLLIPVSLLGMSLPLLFHFIRERNQSLSTMVGKLYCVNALGSFLGALMGGYYLFHFLDFSGVYKVAMVGLLWTLLLTIVYFRVPWRGIATGGVAMATVVLCWLPSWSDEVFLPLKFFGKPAPADRADLTGFSGFLSTPQERVLFSTFDPNTYVTVVRETDQTLTLNVNAKPDASTGLDHYARSMTALIPLQFVPEAKDVFIVGLGAGLSLGITTNLSDVQHVQVAEISQGVVDSLPYFEEHNLELSGRKSKYDIVTGDAYRVLKNEDRTFDLILSEPSNPWVAGVEKLYTKEFLERASKKLSPKGLYSQWFPLFQTNEAIFRSVLRNFKEVFPWVSVWYSGSSATVILAGFEKPSLDEELLARRFEENRAFYQRLGFKDFRSTVLLEMYPSWAVDLITQQGAKVHSLEQPSVGFQAARAAFAEISIDPESLLESVIKWPGVLSSRPPESFLYEMLPPNRWSGQMFLDFEHFSTVQNGLTFHKNRVAMLAHELLGGKFQIPEKVWKDYERLTSGNWDGLMLTDLERLWRRHQRAIASLRAPDTAGYLQALQRTCQGSTQCGPLIASILRYYDLSVKGEPGTAELDLALDRLVEIIKKGPKNS